MQPDSSLPQDQNPVPQELSVAPAIPEKGPARFNIKAVLLVLLVLIAAGLGIWNTQLNKNLQKAQQDHATLDNQYRTLIADKDAVSAEFDAASGELQNTRDAIDAANETLANVKAELEKTNKAISVAKNKMKKAFVYVDFMRALFEDNLTTDEALELAQAVDAKTEELYTAFTDKPDYEKTWIPFVEYVLSTAMDILKK